MRANIIVILASLLLCFYVYPSAFIYPANTLPDNNDTRLISYIIGQVQENLIKRQPLYTAHFFAPEKNTLTYSDLFLTTSIITLPFRLITMSPIVIFNLGFILNFVLTCIFALKFFEYLLTDKYSSILATIVFVLSGYHLQYYPHQQLFSLWLFFAALLFAQKYFSSGKIKFLTLFLTFSTLQLTESIFTFYLLFFAFVFMFKQRSHRKNLMFIANLLIFPIIWILLLLPYINTHLLYPEALRPIRDAAHFSLGLEQIFTLYHSWVVIILLAITLFSTKINNVLKWLLSFSLIMSLGPVLKIFGQNIRPLQGLSINWPIPLPYTVFYYLFPGFTGFRTPSRFILLALFASSIIIGFGAKKYFAYLTHKTKLIFLLFVFCLLSIEANLPLSSFPVNINRQSVYEQVKQLPQTAIILELPIKLWNDPDHEIESVRSLYSLYHNHNRFNGFSGFSTLSWISLVEKIKFYGLTPEMIQTLKTLGVTHVVQNNSLVTLK